MTETADDRIIHRFTLILEDTDVATAQSRASNRVNRRHWIELGVGGILVVIGLVSAYRLAAASAELVTTFGAAAMFVIAAFMVIWSVGGILRGLEELAPTYVIATWREEDGYYAAVFGQITTAQRPVAERQIVELIPDGEWVTGHAGSSEVLVKRRPETSPDDQHHPSNHWTYAATG